MKLSETSIRRPVLASMFSAALVLFGVIGYTRLAVRELPDIDPPIISVSTTLPGANSQVVETAVTDVLEEELSTIQGLRTLSSSSSSTSVTAVSTTCALAPGRVVETEMIGGSMSGSSRTDSRVYPMTPNSTRAAENMLASTGRRMDVSESFM